LTRQHGRVMAATRSATAQQTAGFTLLEVLTALVILSLIMTVALGSVRLGSRAWEAGITRAGDTDRMRSVADFLNSALSQFLPVTWQEGRNTQIAFEGDATGMRFIAPAPRQLENSGLLVYRLAADESASGFRLVMDYAMLDPGGKGFATAGEAHRLVLAEGLRSVSFAYYGSTHQDGNVAWQQRWDVGSQRFPRLVRLRFEATDNDRSWPELVLNLQPEALL